MKKLLSLLIAAVFLPMLCACGTPAVDSPSLPQDSQEGKRPERVITASSLISLEEAEGILQTKLEVMEMDKEIPGGKLQCVYANDEIMLQIFITQDALMSGLNLEYGGAENTFNELVKFQREDSPEYIFEAGDLGEEAYFMDLAENNRWSLHILQRGCIISLHLDGTEEKDCVWEKLEEAGRLGAKNLAAAVN